jgi:hypothetical protein
MIPSIIGSSKLLTIQIVLIITRRATGRVNQIISIPVNNLGQVLIIPLSVPGRQCIGGRVGHGVLLEDGRVLVVGMMRCSVGIVSSIVIAHLMVATISLTCSNLVVVVVVVVVVVGVDVVGRE